MKQILIIMALFAGVNAFAQSKPTETAMTAVSSSYFLLDTNTNTQTNYYYSPVNYTAGNVGNFTAQLIATKVSGTVVDTVWLESTVDGSNWNTLDCPCSFAGTTSTTSRTVIADATGAQSVQYHCTGIKAKQIRLKSKTAGTMVVGNKVLYLRD